MSDRLKSNMKSRKLWIFIFLFFFGTSVWYWSEASMFPEWVDFIKWIFGIYIIGNGIEHGANAYKNENGKKK